MGSARLSVAPMMDWTDRHCRYFHRLISRHVTLYTEMVTAPALVRGGALHLLDFSPQEHPLVLQLGGSDPEELAKAAAMGAAHGYDEINLNIGCPSDRVQSGCFGAVLMERPELVARCVEAMCAAQPKPVSVKCRIGVDDQDPKTILPGFLSQMRDAGVSNVTVHARKAWLQGLSPKQNRDIPPLDYDLVHGMKAAFPQMELAINGGIETLDDTLAHLEVMDGVMIGRAAYHSPWDVLADADHRVYGASPHGLARADVVEQMVPYIEQHLSQGGRLHQITRHMLGLFAGQPGARAWRRVLSQGATAPDASTAVLMDALDQVIANDMRTAS